MSVTDSMLPDAAAQIAARRAHVARQLDLMIDQRGPVAEVRRLIADLDAISADLAQALHGPDATTRR